jgi:hypothetical protein
MEMKEGILMNRFNFSTGRRWLAAAAVGLLALCCAAPGFAQDHNAKAQDAVGTWVGEVKEGNKVERFITVREADGTYSVHARIYENGKGTSDIRNSGLWGISNGLYFTVITEVNGTKADMRNPQLSNSYIIQLLDANTFEYTHLASGYRFRVVRAQPGTKLPD